MTTSRTLTVSRDRAESGTATGEIGESSNASEFFCRWRPALVKSSSEVTPLFVVHHRPLTIERSIRVWPLSTDLSLPIPQLALWIAAIEPDDTTKIDMFAAPRVFKQTSPPSNEEYWDGQVTRRRVVLGDASDLSGDAAKVRIEANSVLARNPVIGQVRDWTVWTPILWLATLVSAILSDTIKGWIMRLLRLGKRKETPRGSEATTT